MNIKRLLVLAGTVLSSLTLVSMWLLFLSEPTESAFAAGDMYTVCQTEPPTCDYSVIQDAVDAAVDGDVIKVAAGTYDDINNRYGLAQIVYVEKSVTIQGGYTTAFTEPPDPEANPTTLDASGQGRVIYIEGNINPTIEGFRITGGEAKDLGSPLGIDAGGGVFIYTATATIRNNQIFNNAANSSHNGDGGGVWLFQSNATLEGNTISNNSAQRHGGGVALLGSNATLKNNIISENISSAPGDGLLSGGAGLHLLLSDALLSGNTIISNTANTWWGGGILIHLSAATLKWNTIRANTAPSGGGVFVFHSDNITFGGNTISDNIATENGGGIALDQSNNIVLIGNTISNNQANAGGGLTFYLCDNVTFNNNKVTSNSTPGDGGGISPGAGNFTIIGNSFVSNTAGGAGGGMVIHDSEGEKIITGNTFAGNSSGGQGGGLHLNGNPIMTNNIIVDNYANIGSGINISSGSPKLIHNTIARNTGGDGTGIHVSYNSSVAITNTILVSQSIGIFVDSFSSASLTATLWGTATWANTADWAGEGTIITGTTNIWGDPDFVNYLAGDYHIGENSDAIDAGVDAGVTTDIDSHPRPHQIPDIGADEYWPPGALKFIYLPLISK